MGDMGSMPGLSRYPGEGKGYPLQYSGLENSIVYIVHGVAKSQKGPYIVHGVTKSQKALIIILFKIELVYIYIHSAFKRYLLIILFALY